MDTPGVERRIVDRIEKDLTNRRGLRHEWERIAPDIQQEIRDTWLLIVREELSKHAAPV